jgi:S1-C subfamily serine protease
VVYAVIPDSAGAAADIHVGDVLLRIDNRDADELTPLQLRLLMSADGVERRLLLERDGRMLTLVLMLTKRI